MHFVLILVETMVAILHVDCFDDGVVIVLLNVLEIALVLVRVRALGLALVLVRYSFDVMEMMRIVQHHLFLLPSLDQILALVLVQVQIHLVLTPALALVLVRCDHVFFLQVLGFHQGLPVPQLLLTV